MTRTELSFQTDRYFANGTETLKKAKKEGKFYTDSKYTKIAGHTFYSAMLLALDDIMPEKPENVKGYVSFLKGKNKKILKHFNSAYYILHRSMGYDGILTHSVIKTGIEDATTVINWVLKRKKLN